MLFLRNTSNSGECLNENGFGSLILENSISFFVGAFVLESNSGFVSQYSKETGDDHEFFAESYAAYFVHTKELEEHIEEQLVLPILDLKRLQLK